MRVLVCVGFCSSVGVGVLVADCVGVCVLSFL